MVEVAQALNDLGVELVSTGGTRASIEKAGLPVRDVADLTGFPEMMDGRVKTLHPVVHGGLLGVRNAPAHAEAMDQHSIGPIDIAWIDLYPFESTVESGAGFEACIENIDIGGPAMIRSAAKNHGHVAVCVDRDAMDQVIAALEGSTFQGIAAPAPLPAPLPMTPQSPPGSRHGSRIRPRSANPSPASWPRPCATARTRIRRVPSTAPPTAVRASPTPASYRARSWATTTSPMLTPLMSW